MASFELHHTLWITTGFLNEHIICCIERRQWNRGCLDFEQTPGRQN
jgi:hypothetical protein